MLVKALALKLDENVKSIILGVLNEAEDAINTIVDTVLEMELNPIKSDCNKDFMIDWGEYKDGYKVKYPVKSWDKIFPRSMCPICKRDQV